MVGSPLKLKKHSNNIFLFLTQFPRMDRAKNDGESESLHHN
jgi:hypothetical protein